MTILEILKKMRDIVDGSEHEYICPVYAVEDSKEFKSFRWRGLCDIPCIIRSLNGLSLSDTLKIRKYLNAKRPRGSVIGGYWFPKFPTTEDSLDCYIEAFTTRKKFLNKLIRRRTRYVRVLKFFYLHTLIDVGYEDFKHLLVP